MSKFPADAPADRVFRALAALEFEVVRSGNHVSLARTESDGTITPNDFAGTQDASGWHVTSSFDTKRHLT